MLEDLHEGENEEHAELQSEIWVVGVSKAGKSVLVAAVTALRQHPGRPCVLSSSTSASPEALTPDQGPQLVEAGLPQLGHYPLAAGASPSSPPASEAQPLIPWHIQTKYYTADVTFRIHTLHQSTPLPSPPPAPAPAPAPEALVLVFDATLEASFAAVQEWAQHHQQESLVEQAEIRLVVSTHIDTILSPSLLNTTSSSLISRTQLPSTLSPSTTTRSSTPRFPTPASNSSQHGSSTNSSGADAHTSRNPNLSEPSEPYQAEPACARRPAWHTAVAEWCVAHGWEYVETCAALPGLDAQLQVEGDRHGVARVVEALSAHMWPGLVEVEVEETGRPSLFSSSTPASVSGLTGQGHEPVHDSTAGNMHSEDLSQQQQQQHPAEERLQYVPPQLLESDQEQQQQQQDQEEASESPAIVALLQGSSEPCQESQPAVAATAASQSIGQEVIDDAIPSEGMVVVVKPSSNGGAGHGGAGGGGAGHGGGGEDGEKHVDDFEKLMGEMQGLRSISSQVSDAERRRSAAALAMRFAAMLGAGGSEDEDGEGSSANCDSDSY